MHAFIKHFQNIYNKKEETAANPAAREALTLLDSREAEGKKINKYVNRCYTEK